MTSLMIHISRYIFVGHQTSLKLLLFKHLSSLNTSTKVAYRHFQKCQTPSLELLLGPLAAISINNEILGGTNIRKTALHLRLVPSSQIWQLNSLKLLWSRAFGACASHELMPDIPGISMGKTPFSSVRRGVSKLYPAPQQNRTWMEKKSNQ